MLHRQLIWIMLLFLPLTAAAQVTVAIGNFQNESDRFFLDDWERQIPSYLHDHLSGKQGIVIVARQDLKTVLDEHALSMTGRIDSSMAMLIGRLLSAQYLITGSIHRNHSGVRIDVHIIHTATGRMIAEKSQSPTRDYLDKMTQMLAANIAYQLTGISPYCKKIELQKYPTKHFAAGTALALVTTMILHSDYQNKQREYRSMTTLADFDPAFDRANRSYTLRNTMMLVTGIGAVSTLFCLLKNISLEAITASNPPVQPQFGLSREEVMLGLSIHF
ncbi:hypothetical protein KAR48_03200 [bacterium]|nr:hypothetical protein [bacterium]